MVPRQVAAASVDERLEVCPECRGAGYDWVRRCCRGRQPKCLHGEVRKVVCYTIVDTWYV